MNVRLRLYEYCSSNLGAIYATGLFVINFRLNLNYVSAFHTTPKAFDNVALFLRLGLTCTLILHENRGFLKTLFKTPVLRFNHVDSKKFENKATRRSFSTKRTLR